jgi:hypothetical protein
LHTEVIDCTERHVELDDVRLELRKTRQARVASAQIVDRDAETTLAERRHACPEIAHLVERSAFGDLEHDA